MSGGGDSPVTTIQNNYGYATYNPEVLATIEKAVKKLESGSNDYTESCDDVKKLADNIERKNNAIIPLLEAIKDALNLKQQIEELKNSRVLFQESLKFQKDKNEIFEKTLESVSNLHEFLTSNHDTAVRLKTLLAEVTNQYELVNNALQANEGKIAMYDELQILMKQSLNSKGQPDNETLKKLQSEVEKLNLQLKNFKKQERLDFDQTTDAITDVVASEEIILENLKTNNQNGTLTESLNARNKVEFEITRLEAELQTKTEELEVSNAYKNEYKIENDTLKNEVKTLEATIEELNDYKKSAETLEIGVQTNDSYDQNVSNYRTSITNLKGIIERLEAEKNQTGKSAEAVKQRYEKKINDLELSIASLTSGSDDVLNEVIEKFQQEKNEIKAESISMKEKLAQKDLHISELEKQIEKYKSQQSEINKVVESTDDLSNSLQLNEKIDEYAKRSKQETDALKKQIQDLEEDLATKTKIIEDYNQKNVEEDTKKLEKELEKKQNEYEQQLNDLKNKYAALETKNEELEQQKNDIQVELNNVKKNNGNDAQEDQRKIKEMEKKIQELGNKLKTTNKEIETHKESLSVVFATFESKFFDDYAIKNADEAFKAIEELFEKDNFCTIMQFHSAVALCKLTGSIEDGQYQCQFCQDDFFENFDKQHVIMLTPCNKLRDSPFIAESNSVGMPKLFFKVAIKNDGVYMDYVYWTGRPFGPQEKQDKMVQIALNQDRFENEKAESTEVTDGTKYKILKQDKTWAYKFAPDLWKWGSHNSTSWTSKKILDEWTSESRQRIKDNDEKIAQWAMNCLHYYNSKIIEDRGGENRLNEKDQYFMFVDLSEKADKYYESFGKEKVTTKDLFDIVENDHTTGNMQSLSAPDFIPVFYEDVDKDDFYLKTVMPDYEFNFYDEPAGNGTFSIVSRHFQLLHVRANQKRNNWTIQPSYGADATNKNLMALSPLQKEGSVVRDAAWVNKTIYEAAEKSNYGRDLVPSAFVVLALQKKLQTGQTQSRMHGRHNKYQASTYTCHM